MSARAVIMRVPTVPLMRAAQRRVAISRSARSLWRLQRQSRLFNSEPSQTIPSSTGTATETQFDVFKKSLNISSFGWPEAKYVEVGTEVTLKGFLGKRRDKGSNLSFCELELGSRRRLTVQLVSSWEEEGSAQQIAHLNLKSVPAYSPVLVTGIIKAKAKKDASQSSEATSEALKRILITDSELSLGSIQCLNPFPKDIIVSQDAVWPPQSRHLQMRFDRSFYDRLNLRSMVVTRLRDGLKRHGFIEVETPVLFKSTPEGAREFLVPTRRKGFAYALPQSPQQYKQILMAGGISKYYQFAKCFRDEDHRADRQPEFTQLDLEMGFCSGQDVMSLVNTLLKYIHDVLLQSPYAMDALGTQADSTKNKPNVPGASELKRPGVIPYAVAMSEYGIDKPDLRIGMLRASKILQIDTWVSPEFKNMITSLQDPVVEACKFRLEGTPQESAKFIQNLFDMLPNTTHKLGGDSTPGVFVVDSSKPLQGLAALGHEAAEKLLGFKSNYWVPAADGDVIIIHARKNQPFYGGSTELGRLRKLIYDTAVEQGLMPKDNSLNYVWVNKFPLFSPLDGEPGQGGSAGFCATHHPFTAPLTAEDVDLLRTDPLKATADHYDLVLNGVEIGGGSRRIHVAEVQEYVMRDVLKMSGEGIGQFSHLLEALRAGCPPHAGFAFGFDRLMSVICGVPSIRDVIAFPKNNKGEDQLVGSPSKTTLAQQKMYHLFTEPASDSSSS